MIAPIHEMSSCRSKTSRHTKPPTTAPSMPNPMVARQPIGSRPGSRRRAMPPMTIPAIIQLRMPIESTSIAPAYPESLVVQGNFIDVREVGHSFGGHRQGRTEMVVVSPYPAVDIPEVPLTAFVLERATEFGDKPALIDGPSGRTITYQELAGAVRAMGAGLTARGFVKGDCFAIYMPNLPEYAIAFHGVASIGGIVTTVNPLYTAEELAFQLEDSKARFLLTIPQFLDNAKQAASTSGVEEIFVLGEAEGVTSVMELLSAGTDVPTVDFDVHNDLAILPYSSGTTGFPKGVMLTHHLSLIHI